MAGSSHTITALVEDKPGVLTRVSSMFRRRGFNIASLAVGQSEIPDHSRMTFVVHGEDSVVEQVTKQLYKLIEVVRVSELAEAKMVSRELALFKVKTTTATRGEIMQIVGIFRAGIVDVARDSLIIEATGDSAKIESMSVVLQPYGVHEIMRTGRVAMIRGLDET